MKLSTKCRYGMRAMIEIARHYGTGMVNRRDMTRTQGISHGYLENILIALKTRKLIRTVRGSKGGFELERPPAKITAGEIVQALEGSIAPVECVENPSVCERAGRCTARSLWTKLYEAQTGVLDGTTLQDLLDREKQGTTDYAI